MYEFKHKDLTFTRGSLSELIAYDRYAISDTDTSHISLGQTILFKEDKKQMIGTVINVNRDYEHMVVSAHDGSGEYAVAFNNARIIRELYPHEMWSRWAKGAASVEPVNKREKLESDFNELLDDYKYVPGGRIQAMLGKEFSPYDGKKSRLSAYNCLVLPSPKCTNTKSPLENWLAIIHTAKREANAMAFGCGVGINISTVPAEIESPEAARSTVSFYLSEKHAEYKDIGEAGFKHIYEIPYSMDESRVVHRIAVEDSRFGIFDALAEMVEVLYITEKSVVLDFSNLRPKGAYVKGIDGISSGVISWMKMFDFVVGQLEKDSVDVVDIAEFFALIPNLISQGGQRRGALMEVLNADHPKIAKFIVAKAEGGRITGANLSVNIIKDFMDALDLGDTKCQLIFDKIANLAHKCGEPGVLFMDTVNADSNTAYYQTIDAVNPCAEEPLPPDGVCNLGHHNLPKFLVKVEGQWQIDRKALKKAIHTAVRFQDNIVDYSTYFDEDIEKVQQTDRRIGIGTMGLATVLIMVGLKYGSKKAEAYVEDLYNFIATETYKASVVLGEEKGSFPNYVATQVPQGSFLHRIFEEKLPKHLRNAALLTQAPTGSTGTMIDNLEGFNCSTGIEPYFAFEYYRAGRLGVEKQEVKMVKDWKAVHPGEELPDHFVTSQSITTMEHVRMQSVIQKYVDAAISKTINLPADASVMDVKGAYYSAYYGGCKGVTVYRDGSRKGQVLATKKEDAKLENDVVFAPIGNPISEATPAREFKPLSLEPFDTMPTENSTEVKKDFKKRPRVLSGATIKQNTPLGKMYVTINHNEDDDIEEVFLHLGKIGSDIRAITDALGILLTLSLSDRLSSLSQNEKINWLINKLIGIKGTSTMGFGPDRVDSLPDAVGKVLKDYKKMVEDTPAVEHEDSIEEHFANVPVADICPSCGSASIVRLEGCEMCTTCGAAKCS